MLSRFNALLQRRFVRDTLTLQAGQFILIFVAGITQAIISRVLKPEGLGDYRSVFILFNLMSLLDISGSIAVARTHLARAFGADNTEEIHRTLAYFLKINALVNGVLVISFFIFFPALSSALFRDPAAGQLARWLAITELTDVPLQLVTIILSARREMRPLVRLESVKLLITALLLIGAVLTSTIDVLIAVQVGVSIGFAVYAVWRYRQLAKADGRLPALPTLLVQARRVSFRQYLGEGVVVSLDKNFSQFAVYTLPFLMLGIYSNTHDEQTLGLFTNAYAVITFPGPLISGIARNLDTYLPFKSSQADGLRQTFIRATLGSGLIWAAGTLALAIVAPFVLLIVYGLDYAPAIGWLYPLLLQSLAVGLGVGLGSAFRTLKKAQYSILESLLVTAILAPIGLWLIQQMGGYGAAWFIGLAWLLNTLAGIGIVLWFTRRKRQP